LYFLQICPIDRSHPAATNRLIYAKGRLNPLPSSLGGLFKKQPPFSRPLIASAWTDFWAKKKECIDDSSYDFIKRRFGEDVADYAISAMLCGICAGSAKEISVKMLFRMLFEAEQNYGSVIKGLVKVSKKKAMTEGIVPGKLARQAILERWSIYSLENGLQTLPETIEQKLREARVDVHLSDPCVRLKFDTNAVHLELKSGRVVNGKDLICALPASQLAPLLKVDHPELSEKLSEQKSATVGVVNLKYKGQQLTSPAFGFLVPPIEKKPLLGVIYDSVCFENEDGDTVLTAMMGGHWFHPQFSGKTPQDLADIAVKNIGEILGINDDPLDTNSVILTECIPQYTVGHYERLDAVESYIKKHNLPLHLVGASYKGIGINDVILSAKRAVENLSPINK